MKSLERGVALPIVILFTALITVALFMATSFVTLAAKSTNVSEARATVALFAAESLLNKIDGILKDKPAFTKALTTTDLSDFFTNKGVGTVTLANGATATLSVVSVSTVGSTTHFVLKSTGTGTGQSTKVILKNYAVKDTGGSQVVNTPGALNAKPAVYRNGQPIITGESGSGATGVLYDDFADKRITVSAPVARSTVSTTTPFDISLNDPRNPGKGAARVVVPGYMEIGGERFKVLSKSENAVKVVSVNLGTTPPTTEIKSGEQIGITPLAVSTSFTPSSTSSLLQLPVTNPDGFYKTDKVYVNYTVKKGTTTTTGVAVGKITRKLDDAGAEVVTGGTSAATKIEVNFSASACTGCAPFPTSDSSSTVTVTEGTPVRREIIGIVGAGYVEDPGKDGQYTKSANDPRIADPYGTKDPNSSCPSGNFLFCETFKMDYDKFIAAHPPVSMLDLGNVSGVTVINGGKWTGSKNGLCGTGILVVVGNFEANSSPTCEKQTGGFRGLIYVTGNATMMGNLSLQGGMVVQGNVVGGEVNLGGSKSGDRLTYDQMALAEAGMLLGGKVFEPVAGTWRQQ